jgi:CelD/BcsL family acetyltransferase involved in cellulose biosynthesis
MEIEAEKVEKAYKIERLLRTKIRKAKRREMRLAEKERYGKKNLVQEDDDFFSHNTN